ncbi:hypothetical protein [Bradyrhizobium sp. B117]|uniref:hypothetical protein n=1 Tax=Bradyrhizobium sp. B117 TaxID=3140246 RepID=UPI003182CD6A
MTSKRQFEANRANAKKSTGPKTKSGKSRSSRNALRHGLARAAADRDCGLMALTSSALGLTNEMNPDFPTNLARVKLRLNEVRAIRSRMLAALLDDRAPGQAKRIIALDRYEKAFHRQQRRVLKALRADS